MTNAKALIMNASFRRTMVCFAASILASLAACGGSAKDTKTAPTLVSIHVAAASSSMVQGSTAHMTATGIFSDSSSQDLTATALWRSSATNVATVDSAGLITAHAPGTTTITATRGNATDSYTLTVANATLTALHIAAPNASLAQGTTEQFTATGAYSDSSNHDLTSTVTWRSSATSVATIDATGLVTAHSAGTTNITATQGAVSDSFALTVTNATLASIQVSAANPSIVKGSTTQCTATGRYSNGSTQNISAAVTWRSSATSVATVSTSGLVTALSSGPTSITATSGAISGTLSLTVTSPTLASVAIKPTNPSVTQGGSVQFSATASYSDGSTNDATAQAAWASSNLAVATVTSSGLASGIAAGTATISASFGGKGSSTVLTVASAPQAPTITAQPASGTVTAGQTATFSVVASGTAPLTYQWRRNGTNVGSNASSYTTPATTSADNGAVFNVLVSNAAGSATSADATLTVSPPSGTVRIAYLHHSTGNAVWSGGVPQFFAAYNAAHGTQYQITEIQYPDTGGGYPWANYPYDYWNLWVNHTGTSQDRGELNLDQIAANYDVIVFKHCFPVSAINADDGNPSVSSSTQTIANYQLQYAALNNRLKQFPTKKFIIWTGAALTSATTNAAQAQRARDFFAWVRTTWDQPGDNIFVWDFDTLETGGGLYMNDAYANSPSDPHPNSGFSATVAPYIGQRIVDVIEGRGDSGSITGH
jgi:uncharacterized protein YjdB